MWGFGCHWADRAIGITEPMARSTGDEAGEKEPARGRKARRLWPTVTPSGERVGIHGGRHEEAEGMCDGYQAGGLDSLALLTEFSELASRRRNATKNQKYLSENYTAQALKINTVVELAIPFGQIH